MNGRDTQEKFKETLAIMDDQGWIWQLVCGRLEARGASFVRLPSTVPIRQSWNRFRDAARMIIHWEASGRSGGAVIEEILDVSPSFDVGDRVIVLTTNPTHEDVVYFTELGVRRIVRLRNRDKELQHAARELDHHLAEPPGRDKRERAWHKLLYAIDTLPDEPPEESLKRLEDALAKLATGDPGARELDARASLIAARGGDEEAVKLWHQALDKNPNYFRTYRNLTAHYRKKGRLREALALMQKMQELNKSNISRLVGMGEIQLALNDIERAEFYFKSALDRDRYCSGALNGLAEIRFHQGDLEESRRLLARSHLAYKTAQSMNRQGIELVRRQKYQEALEHYTKAQYVLPQQDKGPLLFYNIGLCYSKWGKMEMAREFLKIALIKEPGYRKAEKLLRQIEARIGDVTA